MNDTIGSSAWTVQSIRTMPSLLVSLLPSSTSRYQSVSRLPWSAHAVPAMISPLVMSVKTGGVELQPPLRSNPQASGSISVADEVSIGPQGAGAHAASARSAHA